MFLAKFCCDGALQSLKPSAYQTLSIISWACVYTHTHTHTKVFDCVDHKKLWNILKEMEIPDHLNCFLRNLYAGQEATVGTGYGKIDWFKIGKGVCQGCILSPCLFIHSISYQFSRSVVSDSLWPHELQHARPPCPSPTPGVYSNSCPLSRWYHLILCHPLLLPSIFPNIRVFSNESAVCVRWPKYWRFSFNISPSDEHRGLISFRMDRLDLVTVQETLKSLL